MKITLRLARSIADAKFGSPILTPKQKDRQDKILTLATALVARYGRDRISMGHISHGLRITPAALRWHFSDLDELLFAICAPTSTASPSSLRLVTSGAVAPAK